MRRETGLVCGLLLAVATAGGAQENASHREPMQGTASTTPNSDPALWRIDGPHATVYLFGTVHLMKPDVQWQTAKFQDAFRKSGTLYLEISDVTDVKALQPMVMQLGLDSQHPLSSKISGEDKVALDKVVKDAGLPGEEMLEPMQPWLAYMTLSLMPMMKAGYASTSGVDVVLAGLAKNAGKPVKGFETGEQQIHYLADLPQAEQVLLLHDEIGELPTSSHELDEVIADWQKGDVAGIASLENAATAKHPVLYKKLVADRNEHFADEIAKMLASPTAGTTFVAIGAAHLAGTDSVQKDLQSKGYKVTRQ